MGAYKADNGKWFVSIRYVDWKGEHNRKVKRGFDTKREATEWERKFLLQNSGDLDMNFEAFVEIYKHDLKDRLKLNTWNTKVSVIDKKILPYFIEKKVADIKPSDIIAWQNKLLSYRNGKGENFSPTYLKTVHNQISAIFNHAVRYYGLKENPAAKAGNMGKEKTKEMLFWTKPEYVRFSDAMMDKPLSFYAFEVLYWCGLRLGELLALTPADFDFEKRTLRISKSYQRIGGQDIITDPKTPKSKRIILMPDFLANEMQDYPDLTEDQRYERMYEINGDYLDDERVNLNIQLSRPIIVIADLGLWNGRRMGYKEISSGNIRDCLYSDTDYTTWYVDKLGDMCCDAIHHDGTNHYLYRTYKDGVSDEQIDQLKEKLYNGTATRADITRVTRRLGDEIGKVYGWDFPTRQPQKDHER